jgi:hypothetical protein
MLIPCDTANPLNSFLNSRLTLKLSDFSFSLSEAPSSLPPSVRLSANGHFLARRPPLSGRLDAAKLPVFCISCNPEIHVLGSNVIVTGLHFGLDIP